MVRTKTKSLQVVAGSADARGSRPLTHAESDKRNAFEGARSNVGRAEAAPLQAPFAFFAIFCGYLVFSVFILRLCVPGRVAKGGGGAKSALREIFLVWLP